MTREIWIPSKSHIREQLAQDLIMRFQVTGMKKSDAFMLWVQENAGILSWIGEKERDKLVQDVVRSCGLRVSLDRDYEFFTGIN